MATQSQGMTLTPPTTPSKKDSQFIGTYSATFSKDSLGASVKPNEIKFTLSSGCGIENISVNLRLPPTPEAAPLEQFLGRLSTPEGLRSLIRPLDLDSTAPTEYYSPASSIGGPSPPPSPTPSRRPSFLAPPQPPARRASVNSKDIPFIKKQLATLSDRLNALDSLTGGLNPIGKRLQEQSQRLIKFQAKETTTIALFGDTGCGKSSLINALIGNGHNIALTGGSGACTVFPVEFKSTNLLSECDGKQDAKYTAIVHYQTPEEWVAEVRQEVRILKMVEELKELEENDIDTRLLQMAEDAEKKLGYVFPTCTSQQLIGMLDWGDEQIIQETKKTVDPPLPWPKLEEEVSSEEHNSKESFLKNLYPRIKVSGKKSGVGKAATGQGMPIIKKLEIYISDSPLLDGGVILVDLPGLHDTNAARTSFAKEYFTRCDEAFAVAEISRAINNETAANILQQASIEQQLKMNGRIQLSIVCTKADIVSKRSALNDFEEIQDQVDELIKTEDEQSLLAEELEEELEENGNKMTKAERKELKQKLRTARERSKSASKSLDLLYANTRINITKTKLENIYTKRSKGFNINVFCVASTSYQAIHKYERERTFMDDDKQTGIPQLAEHCLKLPTARRKAEVEKWWGDIGLLFAEAESWLAGEEFKEGVDQRTLRELMDMMSGLLDDLQSKLDYAVDKFAEDLNYQFQRIYEAADQAIPSARAAAIRVSQNWHGLMWNTYKAICARDGGPFTDTHGRTHDWNYDLSKGMIESFASEWIQTFGQGGKRRGVSVALEKLKNNLTCSFTALPQLVVARASALPTSQRVKVLLTNSEDNSSLPVLLGLGLNSRSVSGRLQQIDSLVELVYDVIQQAQRSVNYKVLFSDKAIVQRGMTPAYQRCRIQSGSGMYARMRDIMHNHISGKNAPVSRTLARLPEVLETELGDIIVEACDTVRDELDELLRVLRQNFEKFLEDPNLCPQSEELKKEHAGTKQFVDGMLSTLENINRA